jgi:pilus assembly protein Flp/PilA
MTRRLVALQIRARQAMDRDRGATAVEYGLMVSLIAVAIITAVALIGTNLSTMFNAVAGRIATVIP